MPTINQLPSIDEVSGGNQIPTYYAGGGDARKMSVNLLQDYLQDNLNFPDNASEITYNPAGTSAVARTVESKLRDVVSVKDFGAKGDGVTDDTAAIQAAVNYVAVNGGTVLFPAGHTYIVSTSISVLEKSSVRLVGQGNTTAGAVYGSIVKFTAASGSRLIDARSSYGISIENLYIWQSNAAYSGTVIDIGHGPYPFDSAYTIIKENIFVLDGASKAVDATKSIIITIRNNYFSGGARAVNCDTGATNYANVINIQYNTFHNQSTAPLYNGGSASTNWNVTGNTFEPLSTGAAGGLWTKGIVGLTFTGNYCGDSNSSGYWCVLDGGVSGATITSNLFAMGGFGVYMQGATANQGLFISGNVFSGISNSDVYIDDTSTAYGDICNNHHYLSATPITGSLSGGRYQINASGANYWKGSVNFSNSVPNAVGTVESGVIWKITNSGTSNTPFVVKAHAGQVTNITEWRDSAETVVAKIRPAGGLQLNTPEPNFYSAYLGNTSATNPYGVAIHYSGVTGGAGQPFIIASDSGATRFNVAGNGNVTNTNNSYGAISDIKLKENITDATPKLAELMRVRIVNYNLKTDPGHKQLGVIAQELEQVFPGMVDEVADYETVIKTREVDAPASVDATGVEIPASVKTEEYQEIVPTGTFTKTVKSSVFVPMLIKAMQEQQATIEYLTSRIAALESKYDVSPS